MNSLHNRSNEAAPSPEQAWPRTDGPGYWPWPFTTSDGSP